MQGTWDKTEVQETTGEPGIKVQVVQGELVVLVLNLVKAVMEVPGVMAVTVATVATAVMAVTVVMEARGRGFSALEAHLLIRAW